MNTYSLVLFGAILLAMVLVTQNMALLRVVSMCENPINYQKSQQFDKKKLKILRVGDQPKRNPTKVTPKHMASRIQDTAKMSSSLETIEKPKLREQFKLALIGERNSGTTWTHEHLVECFAHELDVQPSLVRYKHWFQDDVSEEERLKPTVVVAQFRDPYYWAEAMRQRPYHNPEHNSIKSWKAYLTKPWTMTRLHQDIKYKQTMIGMGFTQEQDIPCQEHFTYNQIIQCTAWPYEGKPNIQDTVRYELRRDGSGRPYESILELRRDKIRNFLSVKDWDFVEGLIPVRYEDLLSNGTATLIRRIEEATGVKASPSCHPKEPQTNRPTRALDSAYVQYMTEHVDWEAESLIGYYPQNLLMEEQTHKL